MFHVFWHVYLIIKGMCSAFSIIHSGSCYHELQQILCLNLQVLYADVGQFASRNVHWKTYRHVASEFSDIMGNPIIRNPAF